MVFFRDQQRRVDHHSLVCAFISKFYSTSVGSSMSEPMPTVTSTGQHLAEVRAFLIKYYSCGENAVSIGEPMHTITSKARFGLVTIHGQDYQIVDIGLRMLTPRELARAQGFPDSYLFPLVQSSAVRLIGNSVCPPVAEALVRANYCAEAETAGEEVA